jgi:hypothetical protein
MSVEAPGTAFGFASNQFLPGDNDGTRPGIDTLLSYMWVKSDKYGTLNWGTLSQATDNVALLPDLSGTIIESNAVMFEGAGFFLRPSGNNTTAGLATATWGSMGLTCLTGGGGVGADCNGLPQTGVRYDTPTFAGFSASTSYTEDDMFDVALKYAGEFGNFKVSAAGGYTHMTDERGPVVGGGGLAGFETDVDLWQVGASAMHVPSGLFIYGMYQNEQENGTPLGTLSGFGVNNNANSNDVWYLKGGIKRTWNPLGATVLFGEYGEYQDMFAGNLGNVCGVGGAISTAAVCVANASVAVSGSQIDRWGLGAVQEIDSAAMHLYARYQHLELDVDLINTNTGANVNQGFDDWDLFQVGGVIFF